MILLIDNYDSFTYNLKQYIEILGYSCHVVRNDAIDLNGIEELSPRKIVISPGPGDVDSSGISFEAIRRFAGRLPILGVCLGHQAIGQAFGGRVIRAPYPCHGKVSLIRHQGTGIFEGAPHPLRVARYHSLIVEKQSLPACLEITAESEDGLIMGLKHKSMDVQGVQFHPESVATDGGLDLLRRFLNDGASTCVA